MKKKKEKLLQLSKASLEKELQKKTAALDKAKRELKIETSLEAVRAIALLMKKREDMLQVCTNIAKQLELLQVKEIRNVQTAIFYEDKGTYMNYEYYAKHDKTFITETIYTDHKIGKSFAAKMLKGKGEFLFTHIKGDQVKDWLAYQKTTNVFIDDYLNTAASLSYYWFSLGPVALGISTYSPLNKKEINLFKRFLKVFELSYRRYLDIEKAEAQAKEAEIELALERVRARTMAMQHSDELHETTLLLFKQFKELGQIASQVSIAIFDNELNNVELYITLKGDKIDRSFTIEIGKDPFVWIKARNDFLNGDKVFIRTLTGKELQRYNHTRNAIAGSNLYDDSENILGQKWNIYGVFFSKGALTFSSNKTVPDETIKLLERFGKVFEQTYTRFLDLQKAEAQAREAQIEVALERVRSRTMAMFKSDELAETAAILVSQLNVLGIAPISLYIGIIRDNHAEMEIWSTDEYGKEIDKQYVVEIRKNNSIKKIYDFWMAKEKSVVIDLQGKELEDWLVYWQEEQQLNFKPGNFPEHRLQNIAYFSKGFIAFTSSERQYGEAIQLLERFAAVFNLTYTRFLDLQKAEAQARESQIEAALERVRSRSMGMQKSEDLKDIIQVVYDQLVQLNIMVEHAGFIMDYKEREDMHIWLADKHAVPFQLTIPYFDAAHWNSFNAAKANGEDFFANLLSFDEKNKFYQDLFKLFPVPDEAKAYYFSCPGLAISTVLLDNVGLYIENFSAIPYTKEENATLMRFGKVFQQTYTRFNDLQKAEAQAREAQIEAALERVRSVAMSMMKSDDLMAICQSVFTQLPILGFTDLRAAQIYIRDDEEEKFLNYDYSDDTGADRVEVNYNSHPYTRSIYDVIRSAGDGLVHNTIQKKELDEWKAYLYNTLGQQPEQKLEDAEELHYYLYSFGIGAFGICTFKAITKDELDILKRFRNVFSLSYQRYSDIALAEAQAREAQIELSLERVRAKTMAMHNSRDVGETAAVMVDELNKLGIETIRCGIGIMHEPGDMEVWTISTDENNKTDIIIGWLDMNMHPLLQGAFESWRRKIETYTYELKADDLLNYYNAINNYPGYPIRYDMSGLPAQIHHNEFHFAEGTLFAFSLQRLTDEQKKIFKRFAGVFGQTYRRYLDLQKAEAQGREAIIEAALERVRGSAMAMRNSDDLSSTASAVFTELRKLGIHPIRSGVGIISAASRKLQFYSTASSAGGDSLSLRGGVAMYGHPEFEKQYEAWVKQENYFTVLKGKELQSYYAFLFAGFTHPDFDNEARPEQYGHWLMFSEGFLFAWSDKPYTETEINILDRFKKIVELTFKRYFDLQKSEANARDAVKQASLDRVRAEIASMRTAVDLERITPLIWDELKILGIPFIRCGVFLMDEQEQQIHTFLSTPNGKAIAAFHLSYNTPGNFAEIVSHWRRKENYVNHWGVADFMNLAGSLVQQGAIATQQQYINSIPNEGIYLHFLPFLQGMLYVGNEQPLSMEAMCLVQNLADAFSTAYARYEDFNKLEAAKGQIEKTLVDLKQAQAQLVQSEKMASLGELTAGIAHEIQNPLNFVNNFSEVSTELIDEMKAEMDKGNSKEAKSIAGELKQNLEKINHHGKRAGDIVKGMLQHSRTSSANREPANINKLADEYLRLAFHGLRSKDKSFNATLVTDYDDNIGSINIIPQDMGRVLLNLYANAFYAVTEKKKQQPENYEPTVSVRTRHQHDRIEITVEDNGNGIPQKVVDKIFQPFFTTKPTGQGTGLGLSLSYDIIKVHGGEIKVNTNEGSFTKMVVEVPIS